MNQQDPEAARLFEYIAAIVPWALVKLTERRGVVLDGPTFRNSPAWNVHLLMCENVTVRNVTIFNPWYAQNGDGIDIESCRNVVMSDSLLDVGDDGICRKSGKDEQGRQPRSHGGTTGTDQLQRRRNAATGHR